LLCLLQRNLGTCEIFLCELQLLFEKQPSLGSLGHSKRLSQLVQFLDVCVCELRSALGVAVVDLDGDDAVFGCGNAAAFGKGLASGG
jgi:hypothetical protein